MYSRLADRLVEYLSNKLSSEFKLISQGTLLNIAMTSSDVDSLLPCCLVDFESSRENQELITRRVNRVEDVSFSCYIARPLADGERGGRDVLTLLDSFRESVIGLFFLPTWTSQDEADTGSVVRSVKLSYIEKIEEEELHGSLMERYICTVIITMDHYRKED